MTEYEAGQGLDALIAERVMGKVPGVDFGLRPHHQWEWNDHSEYNTMMCRWCCESSQKWVDPNTEQVDPKIDARPCYREPLAYSTNIAQAWQVLEHLRAGGNRLMLAMDEHGYHVRETLLVIYRDEAGEVWYESRPLCSADTAPLAICRSALKVEITA